MHSKYNQMAILLIQILIALLWMISGSLCDSCHDDPVILNEDFLGCCKGCPRYSSEHCVDTLLENSTFSHECMVECMYKEFKIYDGTTIDLAAVEPFLDSHHINGDFNVVYSKAFERCTKLEKSSMKELFSFINITNKHGCDVYPSYVGICVWYFTVANCPETYASEDETCIDKREWVKECLLEA